MPDCQTVIGLGFNPQDSEITEAKQVQFRDVLHVEFEEARSQKKRRYDRAKVTEKDGQITIYSDIFFKLSPKQKRFVEYLLDHPTGTPRAAMKYAGYGKGTHLTVIMTSRVKECLRLCGERRRREHKITEDYLIDQLKGIVEQGRAAVPVINERGEETGFYKSNLPAANVALEMIGRMLGKWGELAAIERKAELEKEQPRINVEFNPVAIFQELQRKRLESKPEPLAIAPGQTVVVPTTIDTKEAAMCPGGHMEDGKPENDIYQTVEPGS